MALILNPHSPGNALEQGQQLSDEPSVRPPELPVEIAPTEHASHARDLARHTAALGRPLISVSGDGAFNEVIHGAMRAGNESAV